MFNFMGKIFPLNKMEFYEAKAYTKYYVLHFNGFQTN